MVLMHPIILMYTPESLTSFLSASTIRRNVSMGFLHPPIYYHCAEHNSSSLFVVFLILKYPSATIE